MENIHKILKWFISCCYSSTDTKHSKAVNVLNLKRSHLFLFAWGSRSLPGLNLSKVNLMMDSVFYCHCVLHPPHPRAISFTQLPHTHTHTHSRFISAVSLRLPYFLCLCVLPWWPCYFDAELSSIEVSQMWPTDVWHHHIWLTPPALHFCPKWKTRQPSPAPPAPLSPLFAFFFPYEKANFDVCEINGQDDS